MTTQIIKKQFGVSELFRVVRKEDVNKNHAFFISPGDAIYWGFLEFVNEILPERSRGGMVGVNSTEHYFPDPNDFVLMSVTISPTTTFVDVVANAEFNDPKFIEMGLVARYQETGFSMGGGDLSVYNADRSAILIPETFDVIATEASNLMPIKEYSYKFAGKKYFKPNRIYGIIWENVWLVQIQAMQKKLDIARKSQLIAQNLKLILTGSRMASYDLCFPVIYGPTNPGNSCFMDSTLVSMFAFKGSPFLNMLTRPFPEKMETVCVDSNATVAIRTSIKQEMAKQGLIAGDPVSAQKIQEKFGLSYNNYVESQVRIFKHTRPDVVRKLELDSEAEDRKLRQNIKDVLINDVKNITGGKQKFYCSILRKLVGKDCKGGGNGQDLSVGFHDPSELFTRLTSALNYETISKIDTTYRALDDKGTGMVATNRLESKSSTLPPLRVSDMTLRRVAYPDSWDSPWNYVDTIRETATVKGKWTKTSMTIEEAEVIVVHLDRSFPGHPTRVNKRRIVVDSDMRVKGQIYLLRAVVYPPVEGHYTAYLKCGDHWFSYNDSNNVNPLGENIVDSAKVKDDMETKGVLFFYYPPLDGEVRPANIPLPDSSVKARDVTPINTGLGEFTGQPLGQLNLGSTQPGLGEQVGFRGQNQQGLGFRGFSNDNQAAPKTNEYVGSVFMGNEPTVLSLNVDYNAMTNNDVNSPSIITKCQQTFPTFKGWADQAGSISNCTLNAAAFISGYTIVALQEVSARYFDFFHGQAKAFAKKKNVDDLRRSMTSYQEGSDKKLVTLYNPAITGDARNISNQLKLTDGNTYRNVLALYFAKLKMVFVNIHAFPQTGAREIQELFDNLNLIIVGNSYDVKRVVVAGDFNDPGGLLLDASFKIGSMNVQIPFGSDVPKSCCEHLAYSVYGDYIFDSKQGRDVLSTPVDYVRYKPMMSSHDPVTLVPIQ